MHKEGGARRREAVSHTMAALGGKLEAMYYAFGEDDAFVIVELPDNASAAAALAASGSGTLQIQTVALLTPEEIDKAVKQKIDFRPPGR